MEFIDSHAHLADPAFAEDVEDVIGRARRAGAAAVVCISTSPDNGEATAALAAAHPDFLFQTAGYHPHEAQNYDPVRDLPRLQEQIAAGAVAVGECGLDYFYENSPRTVQRRAFAEQLMLARDTGRPVVVHTREAADDTAAMVREAAAAGVRGVLHCFTGPASLADAALESGWFISFSGIVTFPKFSGVHLMRMVPEDRLLVESDSPYLAPAPHRGKRNEPAWVGLTLARLAQARGADVTALGIATTANARQLFSLAAHTGD